MCTEKVIEEFMLVDYVIVKLYHVYELVCASPMIRVLWDLEREVKFFRMNHLFPK